MVTAYRTRFKAEYRDAPDRLYEQVVALLTRFGLLYAHDGPDGDNLYCHAALARYRPAAIDQVDEDQPGELSLFDSMSSDEVDDG
jgi:hypothetical protein